MEFAVCLTYILHILHFYTRLVGSMLPSVGFVSRLWLEGSHLELYRTTHEEILTAICVKVSFL